MATPDDHGRQLDGDQPTLYKEHRLPDPVRDFQPVSAGNGGAMCQLAKPAFPGQERGGNFALAKQQPKKSTSARPVTAPQSPDRRDAQQGCGH